MHTQDLEKWNEARVERDANIAQADRDREALEREAQRQVEAEAALNKAGELIYNQKCDALRAATFTFLQRAAELRACGLDFHRVARVAAIAAVSARHMDHPSNLGDNVFAFAQFFSEWVQFSA